MNWIMELDASSVEAAETVGLQSLHAVGGQRGTVRDIGSHPLKVLEKLYQHERPTSEQQTVLWASETHPPY